MPIKQPPTAGTSVTPPATGSGPSPADGQDLYGNTFFKDALANAANDSARQGAGGPSGSKGGGGGPGVPGQGVGAPLQVGDAEVRESNDAGDFYCEYAMFASNWAADQEGTSIVEGSHGKLAGFLHVPDNARDYTDPTQYGSEEERLADQAARHAQTREVVGAALRGYADEVSTSGGLDANEPIRILLTGYGHFSPIDDNPTGDFVVHQANIDAAMQQAYGDDLLTPTGTLVDTDTSEAYVAGAQGDADPDQVAEHFAATYEYRISEEGAPGGCRTVRVTAVRLATHDQAIDPTQEGSLHDAIETFGPHAVLSMGVAADRDYDEQTYRAETHADDKYLNRQSENWQRDTNAPSGTNYDNPALLEAIRAGSEARVSGK